MLRAFAVNRALMFDAERARFAGPDMMSTHFDLQPAIAACRTGSAGSQGLLVQNEEAADERRRDVRRIRLCTQGRALDRNLPPDLDDLIVGQAEEVADMNGVALHHGEDP